MELARSVDLESEDLSLADVLNLLRKEVVVRESVDSASLKLKNPSETKPCVSTASSLTCQNVASEKRVRAVIKCVICGEPHYSYQCSSVMTLNPTAVRTQMITHKLCFRCLGQHLIKDCRFIKKCDLCGKPSHHTSLCAKRVNPNVSTESTTLIVQACVHADSVPHGVLEAVVGNTQSLDTNRKRSVRVLFDFGSQRSFITK